MVECHCVDVDFGTYKNTVSMKSPFEPRNDGWVCIDTCIATEIGKLWHKGVETINSCCGHGKTKPSVIVVRDHEHIMTRLGYYHEVLPNGLKMFLL